MIIKTNHIYIIIKKKRLTNIKGKEFCPTFLFFSPSRSFGPTSVNKCKCHQFVISSHWKGKNLSLPMWWYNKLMAFTFPKDVLNDQIFRHPICRLLPALNTKIRFLGVRDRQIPSFLDNVPVNLNPAPRTLIRPRIGQSCSRRGDGRWAGVYSRWGQLGLRWTVDTLWTPGHFWTPGGHPASGVERIRNSVEFTGCPKDWC